MMFIKFLSSFFLGLAVSTPWLTSSTILTRQDIQQNRVNPSKPPGTHKPSNTTGPGNATVKHDYGYKNFVYFANWDIYQRSYNPQQIPVSEVTHVLYAFWNLSPNGSVYNSDTYADLTKQFATDKPDGNTNNLYGSLKQLYILKKRNRHLKTLMTVGGWTYSTNFAAAASTESTRAKFASDVVSFVRDLGFDGVDIDWEYPSDDTQAGNFVLLLAEVRQQLDKYAETNAPGYHFLLTVACSAGPVNYKKLHLARMNEYVDNWNLMAYDYSGSWDKYVGHDANLYPSSSNKLSTPFNTHDAISDYLKAGVSASKIVLGIPLYGRAFVGTAGLGQPFQSVGPGTTENGIWDFKALPKAGAVEKIDRETISSYSYDASTQTLISYDNVEIVKQKVKYLQSNGLGGAMFWEASGDKSGSESLIGSAANALGTLDTKENLLLYPASKYRNLADGMPEE
ncbi:Endochitinase 1 [Erysiphe neolycopersici]|uniref:chitinase n=1 Tax=Erysiphe neolycopersici TaxID=212602 RepID=A0A420HHS2_9PEZI|nr:Endochitinase 1 [Erysiphe neolycopersici]